MFNLCYDAMVGSKRQSCVYFKKVVGEVGRRPLAVKSRNVAGGGCFLCCPLLLHAVPHAFSLCSVPTPNMHARSASAGTGEPESTNAQYSSMFKVGKGRKRRGIRRGRAVAFRFVPNPHHPLYYT